MQNGRAVKQPQGLPEFRKTKVKKKEIQLEEAADSFRNSVRASDTGSKQSESAETL